MTLPVLSLRQISPPKARRPSRLAAGQRRDKRRAPQALNLKTAAISKNQPFRFAPTSAPRAPLFPPAAGGMGKGASVAQEDPR
jgi:hypothetical protein